MSNRCFEGRVIEVDVRMIVDTRVRVIVGVSVVVEEGVIPPRNHPFPKVGDERGVTVIGIAVSMATSLTCCPPIAVMAIFASAVEVRLSTPRSRIKRDIPINRARTIVPHRLLPHGVEGLWEPRSETGNGPLSPLRKTSHSSCLPVRQYSR
jgi:hypothetical protein